MNIGLVGLGSMGLNLAKNIISKKYRVYAYEKNEKIISWSWLNGPKFSKKYHIKKIQSLRL